MRSKRMAGGAALCGLALCSAIGWAEPGTAAASPALHDLTGPGRTLLPTISRYFSALRLKLADGRTARALARALEEDEDDAARAPLLAAEQAGALAAPDELQAGSDGASRPLDHALRGPPDVDDSGLFGAGLGLGFHINPDTSVSASYRLRKPYTGQNDIDYLKFKPGAEKEDISLDFRFRF